MDENPHVKLYQDRLLLVLLIVEDMRANGTISKETRKFARKIRKEREKLNGGKKTNV